MPPTSSVHAAPLSWVLPRPSRAAIFGLRVVWLCLVMLALAWLVSLCVDARQGRTPLWAALLGVLLVAAWAVATRAWLIAATRVPDLVLFWHESTRDQRASWRDESGNTVKVEPLMDVGLGVLVQCRWQGDAGERAVGASTLTRWVPATSMCLAHRWRLFQARQEAVASSGLPPKGIQHVPQRQKGVMSSYSTQVSRHRKGPL
jgi:hypothetical protein